MNEILLDVNWQFEIDFKSIDDCFKILKGFLIILIEQYGLSTMDLRVSLGECIQLDS